MCTLSTFIRRTNSLYRPDSASVTRDPVLANDTIFELRFVAAFAAICGWFVAPKGQEKGNVPMTLELTPVEGGIPDALLLGERDHQD
jgi:hypothetical protein